MRNNLKNIFDKYAQENSWGDADSFSGSGSNLSQTNTIRKAIPALIKRYHIKSLIDAPCGDYFWMKEIQVIIEKDLDNYYGCDIVEDLVNKNQRLFGGTKTSFLLKDITSESLPKVDLIFTRDCLVHLSFSNIFKVLQNYKASQSKYLITTTFTNRSKNIDIIDGDWRPLNLELAPFFFPKPILLINENCTEGEGKYSDKYLGMWDIKSLPRYYKLKIFWSYLYLKYLNR